MNLLGICCKETEYLSEVFIVTMEIFVTTVFLFSVMFGVMLGAFYFNKLYAEYVDKPEQTISNEPDYKKKNKKEELL